MSTDELVDTLARVAAEAKAARDAINNGRALNGINALTKIEHLAADTVRHATTTEA